MIRYFKAASQVIWVNCYLGLGMELLHVVLKPEPAPTFGVVSLKYYVDNTSRYPLHDWHKHCYLRISGFI